MKVKMSVVKYLVLFFVSLIFGSLTGFAELAKGSVKVNNIKGVVTFAVKGSYDSQKPLINGQVVNEGVCITTGKDSSVALVFSNGSCVILSADSSMLIKQFQQMPFSKEKGEYRDLKVDPSESRTQLDLRMGVLVADVKKLSPKSSYDIKTPVGAAGVRGTQVRAVVLKQGNLVSSSLTSTDGGLAVTFLQQGVNGQPEVVTRIQNPGSTSQINAVLDSSGKTTNVNVQTTAMNAVEQAALAATLSENGLVEAADSASSQAPAENPVESEAVSSSVEAVDAFIEGESSDGVDEGGDDFGASEDGFDTSDQGVENVVVDNTVTNEEELEANIASGSE